MNNFKETNELGLISGLMSLGYPPFERRREGQRVIFVFENDENVEKLWEDYYNNRLSVDAQTFHLTQKAVKMSIYNSERE